MLPLCGPVAATAQCAAVLARKHARIEKCVRHGGRSFFEVTEGALPRAFRSKARSHCTVTATYVVGLGSSVKGSNMKSGIADFRESGWFGDVQIETWQRKLHKMIQIQLWQFTILALFSLNKPFEKGKSLLLYFEDILTLNGRSCRKDCFSYQASLRQCQRSTN